jgi:dihydroorotate dehydrogenase
MHGSARAVYNAAFRVLLLTLTVLNALYPLARPLLFSMDPEDAHHFTLNQLKRAHAMGFSSCIGARIAPQPRTVMGWLLA